MIENIISEVGIFFCKNLLCELIKETLENTKNNYMNLENTKNDGKIA